jgi:hypothetical protein
MRHSEQGTPALDPEIASSALKAFHVNSIGSGTGAGSGTGYGSALFKNSVSVSALIHCGLRSTKSRNPTIFIPQHRFFTCIRTVRYTVCENYETCYIWLESRLRSTAGLVSDVERLAAEMSAYQAVLLIRIRIRIKIHRIHMFLGLQDPDPLVRGMDPDPSTTMQK